MPGYTNLIPYLGNLLDPFTAFAGDKYKPNTDDTELIGVKDAVLYWATENYQVDNSVDDAGLSKLHLTIFDTTTRADSAQIKLFNDEGSTQYVRAAAIKAKPVTRMSGALGWTHDAFVDYQGIFESGENLFEFGNNFVVTKAQLESLADYYAKALGALATGATPKKAKHIYTVSIPGRCWWFEPGEWYTLDVGADETREDINSVVECFSVQVEVGAGELGSTSVSFREVEEDWTKDSNALARFLAGGDPNWITGHFGRVVVAARDYLGPANYYCDGTADQTEIQAAINYIALTYGAGVVELTEGQFNTTAAIELNQDNIVLEGHGFNTVIVKNCNDYAIESVGGAGTEVNGIRIANLKVTKAVADEGGDDLIYLGYSDNLVLDKVWIHDSGAYGVNILQCDDCSLLSNLATDCVSTAFRLHGTGGVPFRAKLVGNTAKSSAQGFGLYRIEHSTIASNEADGNVNSGIVLEECNYNSISNNIARDNGNGAADAGIALFTSDYNVISGNIATLNNADGILIYASDCNTNVVTGNRATGNTSANFHNHGTGTVDSGNEWT